LLHAVIMAGGKGERFWPASRRRFPKQFLSLFGGETLIQAAYRRASRITDPESIYVVTGSETADIVRQQIPELPLENLLVEPESKNTAACIGFAAVVLGRRDPDGIMVVLPSDQRVGDLDEFERVVCLGAEVAWKMRSLVALGIRPSRPETGYGYLELGRPTPGFTGVYRVKRFTEKPDLATAESFLATNRYLWNSGIYLWTIPVIREMFARYLPEHDRGLQKICCAIGSCRFNETVRTVYAEMESISIDYGLLERADSVLVLPAEMDWDDMGNWRAMRRIWTADAQGNVVDGDYLAIDSRDNIVYCPQKRLVTLGVSGMIVAESDDCLFILPVEREHEIKQVLDGLRREGWEDCL
jgi:mannose-1-phosphate guanylyltransferase